jgi:hypothetical protein
MRKVFHLLVLLMIVSVTTSCQNKQDKQTIAEQKQTIDRLNSELKETTIVRILVRSESKMYLVNTKTGEILEAAKTSVSTGKACNWQSFLSRDCVDLTQARALCGTCSPVVEKDGSIRCSCVMNGDLGYQYQIDCDCNGGQMTSPPTGGGTPGKIITL